MLYSEICGWAPNEWVGGKQTQSTTRQLTAKQNNANWRSHQRGNNKKKTTEIGEHIWILNQSEKIPYVLKNISWAQIGYMNQRNHWALINCSLLGNVKEIPLPAFHK